MLEAREVCPVIVAMQVVTLLEMKASLTREFPNPEVKSQRLAPKVRVSFGDLSFKAVWIPELELLSYKLIADAADLAKAPHGVTAMPGLRGKQYLKSKLPEDRKDAEYVSRHGNAVIRAVELWRAWVREAEEAVDVHMNELLIQEVMER